MGQCGVSCSYVEDFVGFVGFCIHKSLSVFFVLFSVLLMFCMNTSWASCCLLSYTLLSFPTLSHSINLLLRWNELRKLLRHGQEDVKVASESVVVSRNMVARRLYLLFVSGLRRFIIKAQRFLPRDPVFYISLPFLFDISFYFVLLFISLFSLFFCGLCQYSGFQLCLLCVQESLERISRAYICRACIFCGAWFRL